MNGCNWLQVAPRRIQIPYGAPKSTTRLDGIGAVVRIVLFRVSATYRSPFAFTAIPWGMLNRSQFAVPIHPGQPAIVVTTPPAVIFRIVWLLVSATYSVPVPSTAIPCGPPNRAALPVPSFDPNAPAWPASVVTTPAGVICRIVLLLESATYTVPAVSTATPSRTIESRGAAGAVGASDSSPPGPRASSRCRRVQFSGSCDCCWSATYTLPVLSTATPRGPLNRAALPVPSVLPRPARER